MNEFPLAPFFLALTLDGIPITMDDYERVARVLSTGGEWNRMRLRGALSALLANNTEQTEVFKRRFDSFFDKELSGIEKLTDEQIESVLIELKNFQLIKPPDKFVQSEPSRTPNSGVINKFIESPKTLISPKTFWQKLRQRIPDKESFRTASANFWNLVRRKFSIWYVVAALLIASLGFGFYLSIPSTEVITRAEPAPTSAPSPVIDKSPLPLTTEQELPNAIKVERAEEPQPQPLIEHSWSDVAGAATLVGMPFVLWFLFSLLSSQFIKEPPPRFDSKKPRLFSLKNIGGKPAPQLDALTLDHLADSLSYFLSENPSKRLDVKTSVRAAGQNGGLPVLHFERLKQVRNIYILEDANADPLAWNPIVSEFAEGLSKRGISVRYGKFYGTPEKFDMQEGGTEWLEDLDMQNQNSLFLFFSDGKCLSPRRDAFLLESLAHSVSVAWLDLREKEFWDESAELIANHKIPLYQANAAGLTRAMQRFLTERGLERDDTYWIRRWNGIPANTGSNLASYIERLLGDSLAWAQVCAMIQPLSNGMADALRRNFQKNLPPERIERLYRLPGAAWNISGLRFSLPVLAILRQGFTVRWSEDEQQEILEFIIAQIKILEPEEKDSLRHLAWEWSLERVRLELDPDTALRRLAQLEMTPLGDNIRNEFANLVLPGNAVDETAVPLRVRPLTQDGLDKFSKLSNQSVERNSFWESLKAFRHRIAAAFQKGWKWGEYLFATTVQLPGKLFKTPVATGEIIAEPAELRFNRLRSGESKTRTLTLNRVDGETLSGRLITDAAWLRIHKTLCDGQNAAHTTPVTALATGLKNGKHQAIITFVPADGGTPVEIEVSARVMRTWLGMLSEWWREKKPSSVMQIALLGLFVGLIMLVVAEYALPRNWFNALYNNAPELIGQPSYELIDAKTLRLSAKVKDIDNDNLQSHWEVNLDENDAITSNGAPNSKADDNAVSPEELSPVAIEYLVPNIDLNDLPRTARIKLSLQDDSGGQSVYEILVYLNKEYNEDFAPDETDPTSPLPPENHQNKTRNKNVVITEIKTVIVPDYQPPLIMPTKTIRQITGRGGFGVGNGDGSGDGSGDSGRVSLYEKPVDSAIEYIKKAEIALQNGDIQGAIQIIRNGKQNLYERQKQSVTEEQRKNLDSEEEYFNKLESAYELKMQLNTKIATAKSLLEKGDYKGVLSITSEGLKVYDSSGNPKKEVCRDEVKRLQQLSEQAQKAIATPMPIPTPERDRPIKVTGSDNQTVLNGREIRVKLRVTINEKGKIKDIDVVGNDSGYGDKAKDRVKKSWKFEPAMRNGELVKDKIEVELIFKVPTTNQK